jgi:hypothetical protein
MTSFALPCTESASRTTLIAHVPLVHPRHARRTLEFQIGGNHGADIGRIAGRPRRIEALLEAGGVLRVAGDPQQQEIQGLAREALRIRDPPTDRRCVEARFQRSQRRVGRGRELGVRDLRRQRLAALEIGKDERGTSAPVLRTHFRGGLSRGELAQPAQMIGADRAEDGPRRKRVVANEQ